mgnify:CR=1 FL=1
MTICPSTFHFSKFIPGTICYLFQMAGFDTSTFSFWLLNINMLCLQLVVSDDPVGVPGSLCIHHTIYTRVILACQFSGDGVRGSHVLSSGRIGQQLPAILCSSWLCRVHLFSPTFFLVLHYNFVVVVEFLLLFLFLGFYFLKLQCLWMLDFLFLFWPTGPPPHCLLYLYVRISIVDVQFYSISVGEILIINIIISFITIFVIKYGLSLIWFHKKKTCRFVHI